MIWQRVSAPYSLHKTTMQALITRFTFHSEVVAHKIYLELVTQNPYIKISFLCCDVFSYGKLSILCHLFTCESSKNSSFALFFAVFYMTHKFSDCITQGHLHLLESFELSLSNYNHKAQC